MLTVLVSNVYNYAIACNRNLVKKRPLDNPQVKNY